MALVYRAMKRDVDGRPFVTHASSLGLGIRPDKDIYVDGEGLVHPQGEGLSVAHASPENLPYGRRPPALGGKGKHPVWELETDELPDYLDYTYESGKGLIEPSYVMEIDDYQVAIEETRDLWRECESLG